ncbi:MAG: methyltransferase domain-containing protein [Ruminococcus sp.]|jgi:predicted SAM-dependent methyltransferase|nr:methyltransferase domain-containing protein [Ruminococcus sp.]
MSNSNSKKLHLGCGKRYMPGFIHIDFADFPHIDYRHDIKNLDMFEDNTVDEIYACHCLEHFSRKDVKSVLSEWYRVLRKPTASSVTPPRTNVRVTAG